MLFIPFREYAGAIGGPGTFMRNLERYLSERKIAYTDDPARGTAAFFPIKHDLALLRRYKRRGYPIIQRLDGVYYLERTGIRYLWRNREIKRIYREFSDYVVFQSAYSKRQCFAMFGSKIESKFTTIVNGADSDLFRPAPRALAAERPLRVVTSGSFRHDDMIGPIVRALDELSGELELELTVVGPIPPELRARVDRKYARFTGKLGPVEVARALAESDIYIFCALNPPCPNSVLEAIASGLPVVGFAEGSMPELLAFSPELLAEVPDKLFLRAGDRDHRGLIEKLRLCVRDYERFASAARAHGRDYEFARCGAAYVRVFERLGVLAP